MPLSMHQVVVSPLALPTIRISSYSVDAKTTLRSTQSARSTRFALPVQQHFRCNNEEYVE